MKKVPPADGALISRQRWEVHQVTGFMHCIFSLMAWYRFKVSGFMTSTCARFPKSRWRVDGKAGVPGSCERGARNDSHQRCACSRSTRKSTTPHPGYHCYRHDRRGVEAVKREPWHLVCSKDSLMDNNPTPFFPVDNPRLVHELKQRAHERQSRTKLQSMDEPGHGLRATPSGLYTLCAAVAAVAMNTLMSGRLS